MINSMLTRQIAEICLILPLLGGCVSGEIYHKDNLRDLSLISIDARQRLGFSGSYSNKNGSGRAVCMEPSPDAAVASAAALAASGSLPSSVGTGTQVVPLNFGASRTEALASLGLRTQTIQLLRDGYYRLCEGLLNGVVTQNEYQAVLVNIDATMIALAAVDALGLGGTTQAPAVVVAPGSVNATAGTTTTNAAGTTPSIQGTFVTTQKMDPAQAKAIQEIAMQALRNAKERQNYIWTGK